MDLRRLATMAPVLCLAVVPAGSVRVAPANLAIAEVAHADPTATGTVEETRALPKGPKLTFKLASIDPAQMPAPEQPSLELPTTSADGQPRSENANQMIDVQPQDV